MVISLRRRLIAYLFVGGEQDLTVLDAYFQIGASEYKNSYGTTDPKHEIT